MTTANRLTKLFESSSRISFNDNSKIIIMSDSHRGMGNAADEFRHNQNLFWYALEHYYKNGFTYIELGDGDELWENKSFFGIMQIYKEIFETIKKFDDENRLYKIYGNHDKEKKKFDVPESLVLKHSDNGNQIFLAHGHQGDFINDQLWLLGRFLVRYVWRPLQLIGINDPTQTSKNYKKKNSVEQRLSDWANSNNQLSIFGHTHKPTLPRPTHGKYINGGSCVHPECISGIEIENGKISLIEWRTRPRQDGVLTVAKKVITSYTLDDYFK